MSKPEKCPYELRDSGKSWWAWAWSTPQSAKWGKGVLYTVARRAQLEDDLAALDDFDGYSLEDFFSSLELGDEDSVQRELRELGRLVGRLQALAGSRLAVCREMRELEMQLGLSPKAMAGLGWKDGDEQPKRSKVDELRARRDAKAAGGSTA